jgi:thiamine transport system permease protein
MSRVLKIALPLAFLVLFYFYPLWAILRVSFVNDGIIDLAALSVLWEDAYYLQVLWFSVWQAAVSTLATLLVALPAAYLFANYAFHGKTLLRAVAAVPFVLPTLVVASAFNVMSDRNSGIALMIVAHVFYNYTLVLRIVGNFWANLDPQLSQTAHVLGANRWLVWREVTLPLLIPALGSAALLIFIFCFGAFGTVLLLAGPRYATLEVEIYTQAVNFLNLPIAAALSLVQIACTLGLTLLYNVTQLRQSRLNLRSAKRQKALTGWARWLLWGVIISIVVLIVLPLTALLYRAINIALVIGISSYAALFNQSSSALFGVAPIRAVINSFLYGLATVALALGIGLPASYAIVGTTASRSGAQNSPPPTHTRLPARVFHFRLWLDLLFMLPLGTSPITLGFGYIVAFAEPPLDWRASPLMVPVAHALLALPFVLRSLLPTLRSIQPRLREAAMTLGASPLRAWREVDWHILARGIAVAATFAFTISVGEFGSTLLLSRPEYPTIPVVIFRFLDQPGLRNYGLSLAMSCLLMIFTTVAFMLIERLKLSNSEF